MVEFEIWSEGYSATGESSGPIYFGKSFGRTFREACDNFAKSNPEFARNYDPDRLTHWACRLYSSKDSALGGIKYQHNF